jgi:hypothetical protein
MSEPTDPRFPPPTGADASGDAAPWYAQPPQPGAPQPGYTPGYTQPGYAQPGYAQPDPAWQSQPPYDAYQQAYPPGYVPQAYPPGYAYPYANGPMVPGSVVQTPYGTFVVSSKTRLAAGLLGIFLGWIGVGQFYRGHVGLGIAQLLVSFCTLSVGFLWPFIEGIVTLCVSPGAPLTIDSDNRIMPMT